MAEPLNTRIKYGDEILNLTDVKIVRKVTRQIDGVDLYSVQFFELMNTSMINPVPSYFYTFANQIDQEELFNFVVTQLNPAEIEKIDP